MSHKSLKRIMTALTIGLLAWTNIAYSQTPKEPQAILLGDIHIKPSNPIDNDPVKIQPGTPVTLNVTIENHGTVASPAGKLFVRYAFAKPLDKEENSVLFTTETLPLPSIPAGESINIAFQTPHQWPSILDYVRDDGLMREYQAIATFHEKQPKMIGSLAITFSAYYYPGIRKEIPTSIKD